MTAYARVAEARKDSKNPEIRTKLWDWLEEQVKDV